MPTKQAHPITGDRALGPNGQDKLGFREIAARIAASMVDQASSDGMVVGIDGAWGSGKSSLLFLISDELGKLPDYKVPTVINFRPWLIGNRDALIASLFGEISNKLDQAALNAGDATRISVAKAKKAGEALRNFVSGLSKAGSAIEFAGDVSGFGAIKWIGKGISSVGKMTEKGSPSLSVLKGSLEAALREIDHKFIVTIDDVDRLEPREVIELLRLVRSVVDLPNIIYLLCYDKDILAHSIEKATDIQSGHSYLEKIIQLSIMVPKPEPFQLRQWFSDQLHAIALPKDDDEFSRLKTVIDYEGGRQLKTPRSVVRALDAIRFFWPALREEKADLADLVWLQLIKDGNPALYRWIEDYSGISASVSLGAARIEDSEKLKMTDSLYATAPAGHFDDISYRHDFSEKLPGVNIDYSGNQKGMTIFGPISDLERESAIRNKRLSSPDHYRLYFALSGPSHALTQHDFDLMKTSSETDADQVRMILLRLHNTLATGSLTKADIMLERIKGGIYKLLTPEQCENIILALSQTMDEAYRQHPFDRFWVNSLWDRAEAIVPLLLGRIDPSRRDGVVDSMFGRGEAIGWLTTLFRNETFAHGRYGERRRPEDNWLFTEPELDRVTRLMLDRYRAMSASEIFGSPDPISLLFAWRQGGDEEGPRGLIKRHIASDEGLLEALEHLTTTMQSSDRGNFLALTERNLSPFLDYEDAKKRVLDLEQDAVLGPRTKHIAAALAVGSEY